MEEYIDILEECVRVIPPHMVIHRLTGDGDKKKLLAPLWSGDKKTVLNSINKAFERDNVRQGEKFVSKM
jgi:radical SAM superfamily enzyme